MARRRRSRRRAKQQGKKGGLTLSTVSLLAFLFFVLIFSIALWLSQQISFAQISSLQREAKDSVSRSASFQLSKAIESYAYSLETLARDPLIIDLVGSADKDAIAQRSAELYKAFPYALSLRIYPLGTPRLDNTVQPEVSYACLDLISLIDRGNNKPPIEIHLPRTRGQHLAIVRPVYNGTRLIGYLQLALDVKAVQIWIHSILSNNYVEVIQAAEDQKPILIGKGGNEDVRTGDASYYNVQGTRWKVAVWSESTLPILPITLEVLLVFFMAVTLIGVVVFLLKRSVSNAIRMDVTSIIRLTIDKLRGDKQQNYQMFMPEFLEAARSIDSLTDSKQIDRERDDDPNAISYGSSELASADPLFTPDEGVSVEEVDESAVPKTMAAQASAASPPTQQASSPAPSRNSAVFEARDLSNPSVVAQESSVSSVRQAPPALPPAEIFKAYDIRGIVGSSLSADHARLIGKAIASEALSRGLKKMAFARDGRLSGPDLGQAFVQGVTSCGVDVLDIGMVPTPLLYYAASEHTGGTGVMLTGSHNPPDYNGFKMMLGGETLSGDQIQALRKRIEAKDFAEGKGQYSNQSVTKNYIERIVSDVKLKKPLNVVIDCGNGVAGAVAPTLFKSMGCRVTELFCDVDGHFPNHHPDPSKPDNLQDLIATVKAKNADIGLAFDGDGDRLGVVDPEGNIIYPDRLMMLFATDVLSRNHGAQIIYDIKCTSNLTKVIWEKGGEPVMWKTGHSLIKAKMKQSGAELAGEMSGHIFFKDRWYGFDDGLYSGCRLLEILSAMPQSSGEVFAALPDAWNTPEINISMKEGEHHKFIEELMMQADFGDANVTMIDGIRADYPDGWGLVRASNTTPVLVLRFEGNNQAAMERIQAVFKAQLLAVNPDLDIPF
jgi:phosphomannomutase/phosphoglucomutase